MQRRSAIKTLVTGTTALAFTNPINAAGMYAANFSLKGNINHSVCRWTYGHLSLEQLCQTVKSLGFAAIDLIGPKEWNVLKQYGIDSSMCNGAEISLVKGWNDKQYHATLIKNYSEHIELVAKAGYKNLICFSGNRNGMDDETGLKNCVEGLKKKGLSYKWNCSTVRWITKIIWPIKAAGVLNSAGN
jgi:hydroxypyruvate isomerase